MYFEYVFWMKLLLIATLFLLGQALTNTEELPRLNQYELVKGPIVIEGVKANASGLAYHPERDSLFVVLETSKGC